MAFMDTLEWPECNLDKATVGSMYERFTRMANPISCVFCVRQALFIQSLAVNVGVGYRLRDLIIFQ